MSGNNPVVGQVKSSSDLGFPLFAAGQLLQHHDLSALADYTQQLTRLMLRSLFGCGVVCGLCVGAKRKCNRLTVEVEGGVALDCGGNLIHVTKTETIEVQPECDDLHEVWVVLRGIRKCCAPRAVECSSDDDEAVPVYTREQYWYEIQVRETAPECVCRCNLPVAAGSAGDKKARHEKRKNDEDPCRCADPCLDCHRAHYEGRCECACPGCTDCGCEWILLAHLNEDITSRDKPWIRERGVRRFIRPILVRDPGCPGDEEEERDDETPDATGEPESPAPAPPEPRRRSSPSKPSTPVIS